MGDFIDALKQAFTAVIAGSDGSMTTVSEFWYQLRDAGALVGSIVVFSFGYHVVRKLVRGASKGKARV